MAWGQNRHADSLAKLAASMTKDVPRIIKVELIAQSSIDTAIGVAVVSTSEPCWMDPVINYLTKDQVPDDEKEANWVHRVAAWYWLLADRKLYRRSFGREGGRIFYVCILRRLMNSWLSYTMGVRQPCRGTLTSTLSDDLGVLVATDAEGCHRVCAKV